MFAAVVPGRVAQQALAVPNAEGRFVITLEQAEAINHICVFQTSPLPEGFGCTLHFDAGNGKGWSLIGGLTNNKPSAIFRLKGTFIPSTTSAFNTQARTSHLAATLGILCEPLANVEAQIAQLPPSSTTAAGSGALVVRDPTQDPVQLAMLVAKNMFNAIGSFAQQVPGTNLQAVEMGVIEKWYNRFVEKVKAGGVGFLLQQD